ncbi:hypothetical protein GCM10025771_10200 [Niveibacterium umoris]|uniref:Uncharacterized protein n=1 Tax=Niveibacterium umoris TaxID=1193620 RepID=A0A840BKD2_9RHOO|nr:hypothetical protein [Niveibacterium umoris]MBB4013430.1 hypothetical protein [Niveibacterium umoris]
MAPWIVGSLEEEPTVILTRWCVYEIESATWHFVGHVGARNRGRVSSAIVTFDPITARGRTQSGRVYHLQGAPGLNTEGAYAWELWCQINVVQSFVDVTEDILARTKSSH